MMNTNTLNNIQNTLFKDQDLSTYAVIDGASAADLRFKLWELKPEHCCLWAGKLEQDMAEVAPYLVKLNRGDEFSTWLIENAWGERWNIFLTTDVNFKAIRKHLRQFLTIKDPSGETLFLRYYDPSILKLMLNIFDESQLALFFKTVQSFYIDEKDQLTQFSFDDLAKGICTEYSRIM